MEIQSGMHLRAMHALFSRLRTLRADSHYKNDLLSLYWYQSRLVRNNDAKFDKCCAFFIFTPQTPFSAFDLPNKIVDLSIPLKINCSCVKERACCRTTDNSPNHWYITTKHNDYAMRTVNWPFPPSLQRGGRFPRSSVDDGDNSHSSQH